MRAAVCLHWIGTTESSSGRSPFPYDTPRFLISRIDPDGKTWINEDLIVDIPGERHVICSYNTKSYWPMSYHPGKNSLYIPYVDNCLDMMSANPAGGPVHPPPYEVSPTTCQGPPAPASQSRKLFRLAAVGGGCERRGGAAGGWSAWRAARPAVAAEQVALQRGRSWRRLPAIQSAAPRFGEKVRIRRSLPELRR